MTSAGLVSEPTGTLILEKQSPTNRKLHSTQFWRMNHLHLCRGLHYLDSGGYHHMLGKKSSDPTQAESLIGGSWDLVNASSWGCNYEPTYNSGNLHTSSSGEYRSGDKPR